MLFCDKEAAGRIEFSLSFDKNLRFERKNLDIETEKNFLNHLKQGIGDRIVIFVSHHAEVVKYCDIVVRI